MSDTLEDLANRMTSAGFTAARMKFHYALVDYFEAHILTKMRNPDYKVVICGSYAEGWGLNLSVMDGTVGDGSDVDITVIRDFNMHFENCNCGTFAANQHYLYLQELEDGHCLWPGNSAFLKPAFKFNKSVTQPERDICEAFRVKCLPTSSLSPRKETLELCKEKGLHIVEAQRPSQEEKEFRVSYSLVERELMRNLSTSAGQAFILIKYFFKNILVDYSLKSYMAKTLIFYALSECQTLTAVIETATEALKIFCRHLETHKPDDESICMPHYFQKASIYFKKDKGDRKFPGKKLLNIRIKEEIQAGLQPLVNEFMKQLKDTSKSQAYYSQYHSLFRTWATCDDNPLDNVFAEFSLEAIDSLPHNLSLVKICLRILYLLSIDDKEGAREILNSSCHTHLSISHLECTEDQSDLKNIQKHIEVTQNTTWILPVDVYHLQYLPTAFRSFRTISDTHVLINFNALLIFLRRSLITEYLDGSVEELNWPFMDYQELLALHETAFSSATKAKLFERLKSMDQHDSSSLQNQKEQDVLIPPTKWRNELRTMQERIESDKSDTFHWIIDHVDSRKSNVLEIYSPEFVTAEGYKFRLLLNLKGHGCKPGENNISLNMQIMRWERDDSLEWPCPNNFYLELVNLNEIEKTSVVGQEENGVLLERQFRRPVTDYNDPNFTLPLTTQDIAFSSIHTQHDTMVIRVSVTTPKDDINIIKRLVSPNSEVTIEDNQNFWLIDHVESLLQNPMFPVAISPRYSTKEGLTFFVIMKVQKVEDATCDNRHYRMIVLVLRIARGESDNDLLSSCPLHFTMEFARPGDFNTRNADTFKIVTVSAFHHLVKKHFAQYKHIKDTLGVGEASIFEMRLKQFICEDKLIVRITADKYSDRRGGRQHRMDSSTDMQFSDIADQLSSLLLRLLMTNSDRRPSTEEESSFRRQASREEASENSMQETITSANDIEVLEKMYKKSWADLQTSATGGQFKYWIIEDASSFLLEPTSDKVQKSERTSGIFVTQTGYSFQIKLFKSSQDSSYLSPQLNFLNRRRNAKWPCPHNFRLEFVDQNKPDKLQSKSAFRISRKSGFNPRNDANLACEMYSEGMSKFVKNDVLLGLVKENKLILKVKISY